MTTSEQEATARKLTVELALAPDVTVEDLGAILAKVSAISGVESIGCDPAEAFA